ncbi:MAG: metalloregulator ArsR/SmtB family transcription factor [Alphaproteobacteria bacterium]|nr:metalloregulator ArsR/SmtB family transcription factor [Alphaproteobacteria bacterium]
MEILLNRLKAAAEPTRLRILAICAQGELTVSELTHILGQSQPRVSRHLKLLCDAGLLNRFQEGAWVFYRLADRAGSRSYTLCQQIIGLIPENEPQIKRDMQRLADVRRARHDVADSYFRENASRWDQIRSMHVDDAEVEAKLLAAVPHGAEKHLIDIGTGTGRILELMAPCVARSVGVDSSREMLALARSRLDTLDIRDCQVRQGDMYQLREDDAGFDIAILYQVLHYADDPSAVVIEAGRVLAHGGTLAIVDFAPHDVEELRDSHAHRRLGFGDSEIAGLFDDAKMHTVETYELPGDPLTVKIWIGRKSGEDDLIAEVPADLPAGVATRGEANR